MAVRDDEQAIEVEISLSKKARLETAIVCTLDPSYVECYRRRIDDNPKDHYCSLQGDGNSIYKLLWPSPSSLGQIVSGRKIEADRAAINALDNSMASRLKVDNAYLAMVVNVSALKAAFFLFLYFNLLPLFYASARIHWRFSPYHSSNPSLNCHQMG
jgi:hypothetical protein